MQIVRRAALAPEEPSSADRRVAADAARKEVEARQDLADERRAEQQSNNANQSEASFRSPDSFSDDELDTLIERGSRIEQAYQGSFRPRENAVLAQA